MRYPARTMTPQSHNQAVTPIAVSKPEAAHLIGLSVRSLEYHIRCGRIATRKLGRRRLVLMCSLLDFLQHDQPSPHLSAVSDEASAEAAYA